MSLRWQEVVVLPDGVEDVTCDHCGFPARQAEGRLLHREALIARFAVRWRPGRPEHPARHALFLGDWARRVADEAPAVALADYRGGAAHGFYLRDDAAQAMRALAPWKPRFIRRAEAIGQPLGDRLFAMLDAIHVKDPRLAEVREWGRAEGEAEG